jgi:hypothetical protein
MHTVQCTLLLLNAHNFRSLQHSKRKVKGERSEIRSRFLFTFLKIIFLPLSQGRHSNPSSYARGSVLAQHNVNSAKSVMVEFIL